MLRRSTLLVFALAAATLLAPTAAQAQRGPDVTVMTRNLYLGADLLPIVGATNPQEFEQRVTETFQDVQSTDFPARAKQLAREIRRTRPDVIGLQEAAIWRRSPDGVKDGQATPANIVVYDFIASLQRELRALRQRYRVVRVQAEADIEGSTSLGYDVRLTQQDAILVRSGVRARGARSRNYSENLVVPTQGGNVTSRRGWVSADITIEGETFRFVNTHLEAFSADFRTRQARELLGRRGPLRTRLPIIMTGDFNSDPTATGADAEAIRAVLRARFNDVWRNFTRRRGLTCCHEELLKNTAPGFDSRIDLILTKPRLRVLDAEVVGDEANNRTPAGHWPSDHAGLVATLRLPR